MTRLALLLGLALLATTAAYSDDKKTSDLNVHGNGKTALIPDERSKKFTYDGTYHFSPAVRAGDYVFASGVVAGPYSNNEPADRNKFKESVRASFKRLQEVLAAGGVSMDQIVKLNTYHVFDSKWITIPKVEQVKVVAEVKGEFISEPHPAWTAVGTTALFPDKGLVEIEVTAFAPLSKK